jgi:hypothetical protein
VVTSVNLITTFVTYFGSGDPASAWGGGHFAVVAARVSGPRLRDAIVANAFATNFQILTSNVQNASYVLASMAPRGLAPGWLRAPREDAVPLHAVVLCCVLTVLFGLVPFELSVAIQAVFYGGVVLVECASYVSKRTRAGSSVEACLVAKSTASRRPPAAEILIEGEQAKTAVRESVRRNGGRCERKGPRAEGLGCYD